MSESEHKDFYLDKRWLASYFEKDWMDKLIEQGVDQNIKFNFPRFNSLNLYSNYHERFVKLIKSSSDKVLIKPTSVLEIGASLGRTFYEIANSLPSVKKMVLVEPSQNLEATLKQIFLPEKSNQFPTVYKYKEIEYITFDAFQIRQSCEHVQLEIINKKFDELSYLAPFDLVICSNVIDQCENPKLLIQTLKNKVAPNGLLALSCSYHWNDKYVSSNEEQITNIKDLFKNEWQVLGEDEIEFSCRRNERYWLTFMSHAVVFRKNETFEISTLS